MKKFEPVKKVVLAYSGGLDTSIIIPWLKENYGNPEVIAVSADVGQESELEGLEEKAIKTGASKLYILDLKKVFADPIIVVIGVVYILSRCLGKYFGSFISAKMTKCDDNIVKYLGITLLPQAGVSLGMSLTAMSLGASGQIIRNVALFAVLCYELVGPLMTRIALQKAGEVKERPLSERELARMEGKK